MPNDWIIGGAFAALAIIIAGLAALLYAAYSLDDRDGYTPVTVPDDGLGDIEQADR